MVMLCRETVPANDTAVRAAHQRGVVDYNAIVRSRQLENVTLTAGTDTTLFLRSFKNNSAGLFVYVTDQAPSNANLQIRQLVDSLQLQDATGNRITEVLRSEFLKSFAWLDSVDSAFPSSAASQNVYLLPFSSQFQVSAERGCELGTFPFSTLEKLVIRPDATVTGARAVRITSYDHYHIVVNQGRVFIQTVSSSSR